MVPFTPKILPQNNTARNLFILEQELSCRLKIHTHFSPNFAAPNKQNTPVHLDPKIIHTLVYFVSEKLEELFSSFLNVS